MQKYLHIKSSFDALVEVLGKSFELEADKITSLLSTSENDVIKLNFYPLDNQNKTSIPFCLLANLNTGSLQSASRTTCDNATITKYPHDNILLEVEPFKLYDTALGEHKKEILANGEKCTIFFTKGKNGLVKVESSSDFLQFRFSKGITALNVRASKKKLLIWVENLNKKHSIALISTNNNKLELERLENVDILEDNGKVVRTFRDLHTAMQHGIVGEYGASLVGKYKLVKTGKARPFEISHTLLPYYFVDAIKVKDLDLARSYLSPALSNALDNLHLESFFGDFKGFGQNLGENIYPEDVALFYDENGSRVAKIFHFSLQNGKISDITEM